MTATYSGRWTIARSIVDLTRRSEIVCRGTANLRPDGGTLAYVETVSYRLAGKTMRATRAYRYAVAHGFIVATFADGRPFFTLRLTGGNGTAIHHCGDDRYLLTLTLHEPQTWRTCWDVTGTKRLRIITDYRR